MNCHRWEVFKFIKNTSSNHPFLLKPLSERNVLVEISRVLVPLCRADEVILEKNYSTLISKLGPGAAGTQDAWVMGSEVGQGQNWKRTKLKPMSLH